MLLKHIQPPGSLLARVQRSAEEAALFAGLGYVVAAVSGGADSVCLVHSLHSLRSPLGIDLHVAHVDHGLRGAEATADADFVVALATSLDLPCTVLHVDVSSYRTGRRSLQDAARRARYAALRTLARSLGANAIATGHTLDDQAETVLLNLMRGSGIDGLAGIRSRQGDLVRPLLGFTHAETVTHCTAYGVAWCEDSSNASRKYRRNELRLDLLPSLSKFNPRVRESLARVAHTLARDANYLHAQSDAALEAARRPLPSGSDAISGLALDLVYYRLLDPALRLHVVRRALTNLAGNIDGFSQEHLMRIDALATAGKPGRCWQLPRGVRVEAVSGCLVFHFLDSDPNPETLSSAAEHEIPLAVPGAVHFGSWRIEARIEHRAPSQQPTTSLHTGVVEVLCSTRSVEALRVRTRRPGDRMRPFGMNGSRKLQDILVDRKVPRPLRDRLPIIESASGILWIVGIALAEDARLDPQTDSAVVLRALHIPGSDPHSA